MPLLRIEFYFSLISYVAMHLLIYVTIASTLPKLMSVLSYFIVRAVREHEFILYYKVLFKSLDMLAGTAYQAHACFISSYLVLFFRPGIVAGHSAVPASTVQIVCDVFNIILTSINDVRFLFILKFDL